MTGNPPLNSPQVQDRLERIEAQLAVLLDSLSLNHRPRDPHYVSLQEAGAMIGISAAAVRKRLSRLAKDPTAPKLRRLHGRVHRGDWTAYIAALGNRPTIGQNIRRALRGAPGL